MIETKVYHKTSSTVLAVNRASRILDLCDCGQLAEARRLLIDDPSPDMLLARGVVYYWLARTGSEFTIEEAKDILTKAEHAGANKGLCRVFLGLCYWRQGRDEEAVILFQEAAKSDEPEVQFKALLSRTQVEGDQVRWRDSLKTLALMANLLDLQTDCNKGKFFNQRANAYYRAFEELGDDYRDRALTDYEAARVFFERSGSVRHEANTLNNIAFLYRAQDPKQAHEYIDRAIELFTRLGDRSMLGSVKDTKAQVFLFADQPHQALKWANASVRLLIAADDVVWLPTSYRTRGTIYQQLGQLDKAHADFELAASTEEAKRIRDALMRTGGRLAPAARRLGYKGYTTLRSVIKTRHPKLKSLLRPSYTRRKSIIKKR